MSRRRPTQPTALRASSRNLLAAMMLAATVTPSCLPAQQARPVAATRRAFDALAGPDGLARHGVSASAPRDTAAMRGPSGSERFGMELLGGALGSALGLMGALTMQDPNDCGDDIGCGLGAVSTAALATTVGATLGTMVIGGSANTDPEPVGAALGAVLGVAGGLVALVYVDAEGGSDRRLRGAMAYVGGQALMTALGSRLGAAIRDQGR